MTADDQRNSRHRAAGWGGIASALRNGVEIARKGRLCERRETPYEIVHRGPNHRLRHYRPVGERGPEDADPALLIPPLMLSAELWDIAPDASSVTTLARMGADPYVVDFGSPEDEEGGLERTLSDHVVAVSSAVDEVHRRSGRPVHLMGYSQGGMFAYQAAAYRQSASIASIVTFGSGVDLHGGLPSNLPTELVIRVLEQMSELQDAVMPEGVPSWATRLGFQLMDPVKTVRQRLQFLATLSDREALEEREGVRRFMETEGWTAFPGPALADLLRQLVAQNRMLQGGLVIDGRTVTLADITCPILAFTGKTDAIAPPDTVRAIHAAAPRADCYEVGVEAGHFGLVVGATSSTVVWPAVEGWLAWRRDEGVLPPSAARIEERGETDRERGAFAKMRDAGALSLELGAGVLTGAARGFGLRLGQLERLVDIVSPQAGRLSRLAQIRSGTRVSPGRALEERATSAPDDTFFLFDGRAYSYSAANERIDNIVRGFVELGVRHGDHVGVLMQTRPSAVASFVALSRMGAIAVLLRPDLPLSDQLAVVQVDHLLSDPETGDSAREAFGRDVLVLGGGGEARTLSDGLIDMEAIDPEGVALPDWYEPNPGVAGELAAILVSGEGDRLHATRVSNRRWATSAYGTSSACALTRQDTIYCRTPIHHATGLLVCIGGALTSGARLAMASDFGAVIDPGDFWRDVRRYGVNVVFYTGAMLRSLVNAPEDPYEHPHAIRLVAGSGMPKGLWRRLRERFPTIGVVEFFAPSEGNAVLVNLTGKKIGSIGRPLPGAGEVAVAPWDPELDRIEVDPSGLAAECRRGRVGILLERVEPERGELDLRPIRSVFEANDAWLDSRDLVRVDRDGDHWLVDRRADVVNTRGGRVATREIEDLLCERLPAIDLAAAYGVPIEGERQEEIVVAIELRPDAKLEVGDVEAVVDRAFRNAQMPRFIRFVEALPMTAGHRVRKQTLREQGFGVGRAGEATFWRPSPGASFVRLVSTDDLDAC